MPENEFLGSMSFGVKNFSSKQQVTGWYYLLNEITGCKKHLKAALEMSASSGKLVDELPTSRIDDSTLEDSSIANGASVHLNGSAFTAVRSPINEVNQGFYAKAPCYLKSRSQPASMVAVSQTPTKQVPPTPPISQSGNLGMPSALRRRVPNYAPSPLPLSNSMSALSSFQQQFLMGTPPTPPQRASMVEQLKPKLMAAQRFNLHVSPTLSPAMPPSQPPVALKYPKISPPTNQSADLQLHQVIKPCLNASFSILLDQFI
ncbi:hypothetical protein Ciccas_013075 [Cichlidogyrus casuarinus]|uniref:Uncharacterized protein n=1 Tax=Cichlidogyrus casuarinus TaxID=1844966 RepID=A0ABD2PML6_9PLAT